MGSLLLSNCKRQRNLCVVQGNLWAAAFEADFSDLLEVNQVTIRARLLNINMPFISSLKIYYTHFSYMQQGSCFLKNKCPFEICLETLLSRESQITET